MRFVVNRTETCRRVAEGMATGVFPLTKEHAQLLADELGAIGHAVADHACRCQGERHHAA